MRRRLTWLTRPLAAALAVIGLGTVSLAVPAGAAAAEPEPGVTVAAGINCNDWVYDPDPRYFLVFTLDDIPPSRWDGGGWTAGYVFVERRSDGAGYDVCVGWVDGDGLYPWQAVVGDSAADGYGAIAYGTFKLWDGDKRTRQYTERADGVNHSNGYNILAFGVKEFYVGVCLTRDGEVRDCNDERGMD